MSRFLVFSLIIFTSELSLAAPEEEPQRQRGVSIGVQEELAPIRGDIPDKIILPPLEELLPGDLELWQQTSFVIKDVQLQGNTVLPQEILEPIISSYLGRAIDTRQLQGLRESISKAYVEQGYINSGVIIRDQSVSDGVVVLHAVEGQLVDITVGNVKRLKPDYVASRLSLYITSPLNIADLQEAIQIVQKDDRIRTLEAELVPGENQGEANLQVIVNEDNAWLFGMAIDNHRAESIGAEQATIFASHNNISGRGDVFNLSAGISEGNDNYAIDYAIPVTHSDLLFSFYHNVTDAIVIEAPFDDLDVESETGLIGAAFIWPLRRELGQELILNGVFEYKENQTSLLGRDFSLSPGAIDGESKATIVGIALDWVVRNESKVFALRSGLRNGVDAFDATLFRNNPDGTVEAEGKFLTWTSQLQFVTRIAPRTRFNARLLWQHSFDPLLSFEKLAVGGANTVRGYRENFLVRDNGVVVNLEFPIQFPLKRGGVIQVMPFIDYGMSWDEVDTDVTSTVRGTSDKRYITSAGISLSWRWQGLAANLTWGEPLSDNFESGEDPRGFENEHGLQDDGIHFSLTYLKRF
jgi:hemolysin activation/secretion protein